VPGRHVEERLATDLILSVYRVYFRVGAFNDPATCSRLDCHVFQELSDPNGRVTLAAPHASQDDSLPWLTVKFDVSHC